MSVIDEHRIVVLQCGECGQPRAGCRDVQCALNSRPYAGEDVVPADQLAGAVAEARAEQREATIRHAAEFLETLGRGDLARALTRALGGRTS